MGSSTGSFSVAAGAGEPDSGSQVSISEDQRDASLTLVDPSIDIASAAETGNQGQKRGSRDKEN